MDSDDRPSEDRAPADGGEDVASSSTIKADSSDGLEGSGQTRSPTVAATPQAREAGAACQNGSPAGRAGEADNTEGDDDIASNDTKVGTPPSEGAGGQSRQSDEGPTLAGQTLADRYAVLERIGSGGMSVVYVARDELIKKTVAVKVLRAEQALRKDAKARFRREAQAAASIGDPHIIDITDFGFTDSGDAFIVMERLEGSNLRELVAHEGPMSAGRAVAITRQILRALVSAHEKGIIHRDLKAENVFLCQRDGKDYVKLLDFGISKVTQPLGDGDVEAGLTTTGQVLGTPQYLAPEQAHGIAHVDHRADLYALGVMLYEMLTGELPFTGKSVFEVVMKHVQEPPQPPRERRPDLNIPPELEQVVLMALTKDPDERYQSAREMLVALPASGELPGGYTSQSLTPVPRSTPSPRIKPWPLLLGALVVAAGVVGWLALRPTTPGSSKAPAPARPDQRAAVVAAVPDSRLAPDSDRRVSLEIQATPPHARILVDDKDLGAGRVEVQVPPGEVKLEVRASGYQDQTRQITVERNMMIPVRLLPLPRKRPKKKGPGDLKQNPYR